MGIGFKSVYAYTRSPAIHCGDEHFVITDYVHPHAVEAIEESGWWTTLQDLPVRSRRGDGRRGCRANRDAPRRAQPRAILFLRNLRELSWSVAASAIGTILREEMDDGDARRVRLLHGDLAADAEEWLVFDQPVELVEDARRIASRLPSSASQRSGESHRGREQNRAGRVLPDESRDASRLPDSGPVPTPARDNVREGNAVNERLVNSRR